MDLYQAWFGFQTHDQIYEPLHIVWEIFDATGIVTVSSTLVMNRSTNRMVLGSSNPDGSIAVECVTPDNVRIGLSDESPLQSVLPKSVFMLGGNPAEGPLVMASVRRWPESDPLQVGMPMITLSSVGGVTPERDECVPGPDSPPSSPGKPGSPTIHHGED